MKKITSKTLWVILVPLILIGGWFYFNNTSIIITERIPWGLSVGTKIKTGKNYQDILSWEGEVPTLKDQFEGILRRVENDPKKYESLTAFLNAQSYSSKFLLHAMLFALEQKHSSVYKTQFLSRHFPRLAELKGELGSEPIFLYLMGLDELNQNQLKESQQTFSKAKSLSPSFGKPYSQIAKVYFQQCLYDSTLAVLPMAITLDPSNRENSYSLLIKSLFQLKKRDSLNIVLETLGEEYPHSKNIQLTIAQALENSDRLSEAKEIYNQLLRLYPEDSDIKDYLDKLGQNAFPSCSTPLDGLWSNGENLTTSLEALLASHPQNPWLWVALWNSLENSNPQRAEEIRQQINKDFPNITSLLPSENAKELSEGEKMQIDEGVPDSLASALRESLSQKKSIRSELGHYLVHWGIPTKLFFEKYNQENFQNYGDTLFTQKDSILGFESEYTLLFVDEQLDRVLAQFTDYDKRLDVLGRVLRVKSKLSGPPKSSGDMDCPGFKKFQFFIWEGGGQFEIIAQFGTNTWQARMLRISDKAIKDKQICEFASELLPIKVN